MNKSILNISLSAMAALCCALVAQAAEQPVVYDMGIESMRSQSYSIGIFIFMIVSMLVFVGIIALFYLKTDMSTVKTGEKALMGMIVVGVIISAIFAAVQMLDGFLF